ncbi:MAG TPA: PKD domain-containing protein [Flavobacteriales bacterium]|nr:PKD domain-containing protein [Flavobacteriales bacterium]
MNNLHTLRILSFVCFVFTSLSFYSQETALYPISLEGVVSYECGTAGLFTDDNGGGEPQDPYSNQNFTITLCPDVPGDAIQINFLVFSLQTNANPNNHDVLYVFDGADTSAPLVGSGTGNSFNGLSYTASFNNPSGCLTFMFDCNNGATGGNVGWAGSISCVTPCSYPVSGLELVSPEPFPPVPGLSVSVGLCPDEEVTFSAQSASGTDGFALDSLVWNWGDGEVEITAVSDGFDVFHSYSVPGEYIVTLTVVDENHCFSTNLQPHQVLVSTIPIFNAEYSSPICAGSPGFLDGNPVQSITWTALPPVGVSEEEPLPDDTGIPFVSDLFIDFFDQDQVLENCEDIELITANIEHTWVGDLTFWVTCPDGTEVILMENGPTGTPDPNGCTPDDVNPNNLGLADVLGWDYSWNMDADWVLDDANNPDMADPIPSGVYLPCGDLCDFVGCPLNGIWSFTVFDQWGGDNGYLFEWGIDFNPEIVPGITTFTPEIGADLDSSYWMVTTADEGVVLISDDMNSVDLNFPNAGEFDFTYQVTNNFGCTWDTTVNITVIQGPENSISAGEDLIYCGDPLQLLGEFTAGGGGSPCGGSGGTYNYCGGNNENVIFNYCPDVPGDGTMMTLSFSAGTIETCCDWIQVYDGPNGTGAQIANFNTNIPGMTFTATNPDGCISFVFESDGSVGCASGGFDQLEWCVSCGGQNACGFDWIWDPAIDLNDPTLQQPTLLNFDGSPIEFTLSVSPIGFDNCATTDVMLVEPAFIHEIQTQQPSCLADDGVLIVSINEPLSAGPFTIQIFNGVFLLESVAFDGSDHVIQNLTPGFYSVVLFDNSGCVYTYEFEMLDLVPMTIEVGPDAIICQTAAVILEAWSDQDPAEVWTYNWVNSLTGDTVTTVDGNFVASPPSSTIYTVFATDPNGCPSEDETINVNVFGELLADLAGSEFICSGEEATLDASASFGGSGAGYTYTWLWEGNLLGDLSLSMVEDTPLSSGLYCVIVNDNCETPTDMACLDVTIESPVEVDFVADTTKACGTGAFAFTNLIDPALITTSVWEFGDGIVSAEMNTDHVYEYPGFFDVTLTVNSLAGGCEYSATKEAYINVYPLPDVGFYANPQPTTVPNTTITFDGFQSDNVISWLWTFNSYNPLGFAIVEDPVFTFPYDRGGFYAVKLEVEDIYGCTNQVTREIEIRDLFNLFIPTSFTPNNDGTNDAFFIQGSDIDPERFEMQIFDRWGELVYLTTDLNDKWNGKVGADGEYFSPNGTYTYRVEVHSLSEESWRKEVFGYVMLIR